ncbi:hypothetical protein [Vulcanisaeta sp. JCM 14467]|uniref:hypothetical protein n=1 Tax=Vulcanisaeta sp. JCM 14467 TaxID=1295370 RepID=UPI002093FC9C|nr:hypothetical protein [Vulcanisaeta sp. JCM 14467]
MGCGGDGFVKDGYAAMNTTQVWQAIVWSLLYPGEDYVHVKAVNVNEGGLTITWRLRTNHDPLKGGSSMTLRSSVRRSYWRSRSLQCLVMAMQMLRSSKSMAASMMRP